MKIKDALNINNAKLIIGDINTNLNNFSYDTRTIAKGSTFLGIKGEKINGSLFYEEALKRGATTCILCDINIDLEIISKYPKANIILVDDTLEFIITLAKNFRKTLNIPIIAVTGSVGKTSTRNIIANVLATTYKVLKTKDNLNTSLGLAITLLSLTDEDIIVLEMGMNKFGEIALLSDIAKPDVAVITNIGTAHIGNLGSRENILKAKLEILDGLKGPLIINNDNDLLHSWYQNAAIKNPVITYGIENKSDYIATNITYNKQGSYFEINKKDININLIGKHFIYNSLVSFAIGDLYKVSFENIKKCLKTIPLEANRMELINKDKYTIINDTYNASFDSVYYALLVLKELEGTKVAVLGDILELGEYETEIYNKIAEVVVTNNVDMLLTVGPNSHIINDKAQNLGFKNLNLHFSNNKEAINYINSMDKENTTILVKASHSMNFKEIVDNI